MVNVEDLAGVSEDTLANTNVNTGDSIAATLRTGTVKNIAKHGDSWSLVIYQSNSSYRNQGNLKQIMQILENLYF